MAGTVQALLGENSDKNLMENESRANHESLYSKILSTRDCDVEMQTKTAIMSQRRKTRDIPKEFGVISVARDFY